MRRVPLTFAKTWRDLYLAALFEADSSKLAERIALAERALVLRARELFQAGDNYGEGEALDEAMYSLSSLRTVYRCERPALATPRKMGQTA